LQRNGQDSGQSHKSSGIPIVSGCSKDTGPMSTESQTSKAFLTETMGQLPLFPEDSPASHSVQPGSEEARMITVISGRRCGELLQKLSQLGLLLKTLLVSPQWRSSIVYLSWDYRQVINTVSETFIVEQDPVSSELFWKRLNRSDTKSRRFLFQLRARVPTMSEREYSLWLTPRANEPDEDPKQFVKRMGDRTERCAGSLSAQVKMWPTPRASAAHGPSAREIAAGNPKERLETAVMLPMPQAGANNLAAHNAMSGDFKTKLCEGLEMPITGQLNPTWVEWLMGFPIGWTDLKD